MLFGTEKCGTLHMAVVEQVMTFEQAVQAAIDLDAPLNERLAVIAAAIRRLDASYADAADRMVMRLQDKGQAPRRPGPVMPCRTFCSPTRTAGW